MNNLFLELTVVLVLAGVISLIVHALKQPSIVGYIITGLLLGPVGLWHLRQDDALHALSQIGIALLLFLVGLELDVSTLQKLGQRALIAGILQIAVTTGLGFIITTILGYSLTTALYISIALTFSSTIIVVKLLSEKRDLQSLYGRLVLGILLTQDLVALVLLVVLSGVGQGVGATSNMALWQQATFTVTKALSIGLLIAYASRKVFPKVLRYIGRSDELLLICSLAWALGLAAFVSLPFMGFSLEMGGFVAGLALAGSAVQHEISSRIRSIRDFFIIIFFIVLGSNLSFSNISDSLIPALILSVFVILGNPLIVLFILGLLGYKPRTSFLAGITIGQTSEFSLILITLGVAIGHLEGSALSVVTLITILTIPASSYRMAHAERICCLLSVPLSWFDFRRGAAETGAQNRKLENHVILVGAHRLGVHIAQSLIKQKQNFVIVDFNPEVTESFKQQNVLAICGDITDPYIQELAGLDKAKLIISTLPQLTDNLAIIESVREQKLRLRMIVTAQNETDAVLLYQNKIDYVLLPHFVGGLHLSKILEEKNTFAHLSRLRLHHLKTLGKK